MQPTKTYVYTRDEIVEFVRFKSLEKGYDPADIFRNFATGAVSYTHLTLPTNREV